MNNILRNVKSYVNAQLTFSLQHPENTNEYMHNAYGAIELAVLCLDAETATKLGDWWCEEIKPLFDDIAQNY